MKITLPTGENFEGTVDEFKVFYKNHYNKKLIDVIFENNSKKLQDYPPKDSATVVCGINGGIVTLRANHEQGITINTAIKIEEDMLVLSISDFNSNTKYEQLCLICNNLHFNIVVDKHKTLKENPFIVENNLIENDEALLDNNKILFYAERIAKSVIVKTLYVLNSFMERHSKELTLKNFGYTNYN